MPDNSIDIDLTFLYQVADGSNEFIVESINVFLDQTPLLLQGIITAVNNNEWAAAASSAHSLKANLGFFGMLISQALLIEIELACKAGGQDPDAIKAKFSQLKNIVDEAFIKLVEIKAEIETEL